MIPVLKNTYDYFEKYTGKRLLILLLLTFAGFLFLGLMVGPLAKLFFPEKPDEVIVEQVKPPTEVLTEKMGKVVYSDPSLFPDDNISYKLIDDKGKLIIYLTAEDDKLKVVEGATVRMRGKIERTADGKNEVLMVEQIVFK